MCQGGASVRDQLASQHTVDLIERFAHGGTVSERVGRVSRRIETWQLRAKFAAALSLLYAAEVPAYTTLVEVSAEVNRDMCTDDRLGTLDRVTCERHGAIRVGSASELADIADLFA